MARTAAASSCSPARATTAPTGASPPSGCASVARAVRVYDAARLPHDRAGMRSRDRRRVRHRLPRHVDAARRRACAGARGRRPDRTRRRHRRRSAVGAARRSHGDVRRRQARTLPRRRPGCRRGARRSPTSDSADAAMGGRRGDRRGRLAAAPRAARPQMARMPCGSWPGAPGMTGAAALAAGAAQRTGAGMVVASSPGVDESVLAARFPARGRHPPAGARGLERRRAVRHRPLRCARDRTGLGRHAAMVDAVVRTVAVAERATVVDGDALFAIGNDEPVVWRRSVTGRTHGAHPARRRVRATHRGPPGADRVGDVRRLAADTRSVVLLKGPTTIVAEPGGRVLFRRRRRRAPGHRRHG